MKRQRIVYVYRDFAGEWRWRLIATNGKTMADSGEGYRERNKSIRSARSVFKGCDYRLEYWGTDGEYVREAL